MLTRAWELTADTRAAQKQLLRDADKRALELGDKSSEQLRIENSHFRDVAHEAVQWDKLRKL